MGEQMHEIAAHQMRHHEVRVALQRRAKMVSGIGAGAEIALDRAVEDLDRASLEAADILHRRVPEWLAPVP